MTTILSASNVTSFLNSGTSVILADMVTGTESGSKGKGMKFLYGGCIGVISNLFLKPTIQSYVESMFTPPPKKSENDTSTAGAERNVP